jgi:altronate hydrolase
MTVLLLHPDDDVAVAMTDLAPGDLVEVTGRPVPVLGHVAAGHKISVRDLPTGSVVRKYGQVIGVTTAEVGRGDHVHVHNLGMPSDDSSIWEQADADRRASHRANTMGGAGTNPAIPADVRKTFQGIRRQDGSVATRNYVGVLTTVNCSATVARQIVRRSEDFVETIDGVDGVVALTHTSGCGMSNSGEGFDLLRRTLAGYSGHPNIGGLIVVGLGCEVNTVSSLVAQLGVAAHVPVESYTIQDVGGTVAAIDHGVHAVRSMATRLAGTQRSEVGVEHLVLGLQCGGSDGWSGLTANPALGVASDLLVALGATTVLGETPEIYGAEHLLAARAVSPHVADALLERIRWWQNYTRSQGATLDGNSSPGNKAGGITTILEKSLGAVAKAGQSPLSAVCSYADPIPRSGLCFMDTPGYDPVSVTGMVAGGATLICFTTGRGSVFGSRPAPTVKLSSNAQTARRMAGDIDLDCSPIVNDALSVRETGRQVYHLLLEVASGQRSASESLGLGGEEMVPWQLGAVL